MQRYKSVSSSADQELTREKLAVALVIMLLLEGMSHPQEQLLRIHAALGHTRICQDKSRVSQPAEVTMFPRRRLLSKLQLHLETSFPNLEQLPKHHAIRVHISLRSHRQIASSRLQAIMLR